MSLKEYVCHTAGCPAYGDWAIAHKYKVGWDKVQRGDSLLFDINHNGDSDHVGIVTKVGNGYVETIEANTGGKSVNDGDGVWRKKRYKKDGFVNYFVHPPLTTAQREALIKTASKQVGYKEGANNNNKYGKWYGMNNVPYCMIFVYWCYCHTTVKKEETITPVSKPKTKYTGEIPIPTLRRGDKGQEVKELQLFLNWYGARTGEATGKFGKVTEKAQKVFQKSEGGSTTGVYGETSYKKALKYTDKEEKETTVKDKEVYYHKDQKKAQCVITSMVNAMRRYMIARDKKWENITITNAKKQGAKQSGYSCHFNGVKFKVHYCKWDKSKRTAENLRALLKKHPEGVSIFGAKTSFARKKSGTAHGILITHYANGHFYGVNPSHNGTRYGYTKKTGKGIERFDKMNMSTNLKRYSRISYLEVKK